MRSNRGNSKQPAKPKPAAEREPSGNLQDPKAGEPGSPDRLLVLSDGLFAIAITLLVLDLKVPRVDGAGGLAPTTRDVGAALVAQWPTYFAYLLSFLNIGVLWNNHVTVFRCIRRCDHALTALNTLLMLCVSIIPFITSLLANYLTLSSAHRQVAMVVFSGAWFVTAVVFNALWFYAARDRRLLDRRIGASYYADISKRYRFGPPVYLAVLLLSAAGFPIPSLVASTALSILYAFPYKASQVTAEARILEDRAEKRLFRGALRRRR